MKSKCKHKLHFTSSTWAKDSNELFDYEATDLTKHEETIDSSNGSIIRNGTTISYISKTLNETIAPLRNDLLFTVDSNEATYYLNINQSQQGVKEKAWISLRSFHNKRCNNNGYYLSPGDLIKIGRVNLKIREIQIEGKTKGDIYDIYKECTKPYLQTNSKIHQSPRICRVCYCDDKEVESPLINPCKCSGGLKYLHLSCLQHWLKSRSVVVTASNENCHTYTFNQIECELCKEIIPDFVKIDSTYYPIWDMTSVKFKNYITLESIPFNGKKSIYITSFDNNNHFKIGRSHEADLRITDVTVSRLHAQIHKCQDGTLTIEDLKSKFGSLVYLQLKKVPISVGGHVLPLQIGRTLFHFSMKEAWRWCSCNFWLRKKKQEGEDYCLMNSNEIVFDKMLCVKIQVNKYDEDENFEGDNCIKKDSKKVHDNDKDESITKSKCLDVTNGEGQMINEIMQDNNQIDEMNTLNYISYDNQQKGMSGNSIVQNNILGNKISHGMISNLDGIAQNEGNEDHKENNE